MPSALLPTASTICAVTMPARNTERQQGEEARRPGDLVTVDLEGSGTAAECSGAIFTRYGRAAIMREDIGNSGQELSYQEFVLTPQC